MQLRHILREHGYPGGESPPHIKFPLDAKWRRYTDCFRGFTIEHTKRVHEWRVAREWSGQVQHTPWRGVFEVVLMPAAEFLLPGKRVVPYLRKRGIEHYHYRVAPAGLLDMLPCTDAWQSARTENESTIIAMTPIELNGEEYVYGVHVDSRARTIKFDMYPYHETQLSVSDYCLFQAEK